MTEGGSSKSLNNGLPCSLAERDWGKSWTGTSWERYTMSSSRKQGRGAGCATSKPKLKDLAKTAGDGLSGFTVWSKFHLLLDFVILGAEPGSTGPSPGRHTHRNNLLAVAQDTSCFYSKAVTTLCFQFGPIFQPIPSSNRYQLSTN